MSTFEERHGRPRCGGCSGGGSEDEDLLAKENDELILLESGDGIELE